MKYVYKIYISKILNFVIFMELRMQHFANLKKNSC